MPYFYTAHCALARANRGRKMRSVTRIGVVGCRAAKRFMVGGTGLHLLNASFTGAFLRWASSSNRIRIENHAPTSFLVTCPDPTSKVV